MRSKWKPPSSHWACKTDVSQGGGCPQVPRLSLLCWTSIQDVHEAQGPFLLCPAPSHQNSSLLLQLWTKWKSCLVRLGLKSFSKENKLMCLITLISLWGPSQHYWKNLSEHPLPWVCRISCCDSVCLWCEQAVLHIAKPHQLQGICFPEIASFQFSLLQISSWKALNLSCLSLAVNLSFQLGWKEILGPKGTHTTHLFLFPCFSLGIKSVKHCLGPEAPKKLCFNHLSLFRIKFMLYHHCPLFPCDL